MNMYLVDYIDAKILEASKFVCDYMPLDISVDSAYEAMLACSATMREHPVMLRAFQEAVKFLPPTANFKQLSFTMSDGRVVGIQMRLNPTKTWPAFLFPDGKLEINPESKFAALLETPIRVATEWASLSFVWAQLRSPEYHLDNPTLAYLMPWIRECLADWDTTMLPVDVPFKQRKLIDVEVATVMRDTNVLYFPRLSKQLTQIARSGKHLFGQYRMLESAYTRDALTQSPITIVRQPSLVSPELRIHMNEALEEWQNDRAIRTETKLQAILAKAAKKANPKGK